MTKKIGVEKRTEILYARVKPSNKKYVQQVAKELEVSESELLDSIIEENRDTWGKKRHK